MSSSSDDLLDNYDESWEDEDDDLVFFKNIGMHTTEGLERMVFETTDLEALKEKEANLKDKKANAYFRCKIKDARLYEQIRQIIAPYLSDDKLRMLHHLWSTQLNEAMNNSVGAYASKTKNYCRTLSLQTRVAIAAGVMCVGYLELWTRIFNEVGLNMDNVFASSLRARDKKKYNKDTGQKSKKGKVRRRKDFMVKFGTMQQEQQADAKTGKTYGSGVALATAKKQATANLAAKTRNPEGTPKSQMKCSYHHPDYCTVLGHTTAGSKECGVHCKTGEERKQILVVLRKLEIDQQLQSVQEHGKFRSCMWNIVDLYSKADILLFFLLANFVLNTIPFFR